MTERVPLGISLNVTDHETYAVITPAFTGGLNREIDEDSLKWTYGDQNTEFFTDGGSAFTDSFAVLRNGTYTVYAKDTAGNEACATVTVTGIFCIPEQEAYVHTVSDLSVDGVGISAAFERTYSSMDDTAGILGKGWSFSYAKKTCISEADESVRLVYLPDGTAEYFKITDDGYAGIHTQDRLTKDGENTLILTTTDRITYTYENDILTEIRDANGNTVTITLNAKGNPAKFTSCRPIRKRKPMNMTTDC